MSRFLVFLGTAVSAAVLGGCGGSGGDEAVPTAAPSTTAAPADSGAPGGAPIPGDEVCALLSTTQLDERAASGAPWSEGTAADGSCTWDSAAGGSLQVAVTPDIESTLDEVRSSSSGDRAVEELDVFASGAVGVYDTEGALIEAHAPAGSDEVVAVIVDGVELDEDATISLLEIAALAWENRGSGTTDAAASDTGVTAVRFRVTSEGAGLDLDFEVTAQQVAESPGSNQILCSGVAPDASEGLFEGIYSVLAIDITRSNGLVNASVAAGSVEGAGTYPGQFEAADSKGRSISVDGSLDIDDGLRSGTFSGTDEAGNEVIVVFECEA